MLNNQIAQLQTDIRSLIAPLPDKQGNVDQNAQSQYTNTKLQYENAIGNASLQLTPLNRNLANLSVKGTRIKMEMNGTSVKGKNLGLDFAMQNAAFTNGLKVLQGKAQNAAKKAEPKNTNLKKFQAFSRYDDFNFYKDRTLLIDSLPTP